MADENLFEQAVNTVDEAFVDKYVGEGKKYKDVEELAKAYAHAEKHINETVDDNKSLREFMAAQFEQLHERNSNEPPAKPNDEDKGRQPDPVAPPKDNGGEEDLDARILKILEDKDKTSRLKRNADLAQEVMIEHFGTQEDAVKAVQAKAAEMGVNPQFLADTAFQSPKAFFNLMGVSPDDKPARPSTPASSNDVNPRVLEKTNPNAKQGTYEYYNQLRKSDPRKWASREVQTALMNDAIANPDTFFNRK